MPPGNRRRVFRSFRRAGKSQFRAKTAKVAKAENDLPSPPSRPSGDESPVQLTIKFTIFLGTMMTFLSSRHGDILMEFQHRPQLFLTRFLEMISCLQLPDI